MKLSVHILRAHPDARLVPEMRPHEYADLLADIRERGVLAPLEVINDVVLDGRHRLKAAVELGLKDVPVHQVLLGGDESERDWVLKAAVLRRHLTDDQRAMMAAMYAKEHPRGVGGRPRKEKQNLPPRRGEVSASKKKPRAATKAPARHDAAVQMRVAPKRAEKAAKVLAANPTLAEQVHSGEIKLAQAVRQVTHAEQLARVAQLPPTEGVYDVLVVDPPWEYDRQPGDSGMRGEVDYLTASVEELKQRQLPAAENAILWLWTTNAFMGEAHEIARAWGFTVKTILTWDKVNVGLGSWLRNVTEHCLLCVRGKPVVTLTNQSTLLRETRREHSRKPEAFYALVESLCPGRKWELFARTQRVGWASEGIERERFAAPSL